MEGVLERGRKGRHDLSAVSEVTTDLGPLLQFAYFIEATSDIDRLLELVQVEWTFVDTGKAIEVASMLLVKLGQLVEIVQVRSSAWSKICISNSPQTR